MTTPNVVGDKWFDLQPKRIISKGVYIVHDPCGLVRSKPSCNPGCRMPRAVSAEP
jgi:hypothetical protein